MGILAQKNLAAQNLKFSGKLRKWSRITSDCNKMSPIGKRRCKVQFFQYLILCTLVHKRKSDRPKINFFGHSYVGRRPKGRCSIQISQCLHTSPEMLCTNMDRLHIFPIDLIRGVKFEVMDVHSRNLTGHPENLFRPLNSIQAQSLPTY